MLSSDRGGGVSWRRRRECPQFHSFTPRTLRGGGRSHSNVVGGYSTGLGTAAVHGGDFSDRVMLGNELPDLNL